MLFAPWTSAGGPYQTTRRVLTPSSPHVCRYSIKALFLLSLSFLQAESLFLHPSLVEYSFLFESQS